jgi:hypothetical protein
VPQSDSIEQAEQTVMKDIKKIAEASVAVPRLLYEQLGYPVR